MKASPLAQYLQQKSRTSPVEWPAAPREPTPFRPRAAIAASESSAPSGAGPRRAALLAAVDPLAEDLEDRRGASEDEAPARRGAAVFRPREASPPQPAPDIENRLSEAYHRGVQEGLDAARAEAATARALERAELQKRAVVERLDFQMNEYAKLAEVVAAGLCEVERRIADVTARILQPFLTQAVTHQVVAELVENVAKLRVAGRPALLRIRGPERLLNVLKEKISALAVDVEYVAADGVEITVEAQHTTIASEIAPWAKLIASLSEPG